MKVSNAINALESMASGITVVPDASYPVEEITVCRNHSRLYDFSKEAVGEVAKELRGVTL